MEASVRWSSSSNSGIRLCQKWQHLNAEVMGHFCILFNKKVKLSFDLHSLNYSKQIPPKPALRTIHTAVE